jgi:hypothetical protein
MRDLIRKTLREYHHPVLVYEIKLSQNLQEGDTFIRFIKKETPEIVLMKNDHSQDSIGDSGFSRVDPDYINDSIREIEPDIVSSAKKIVDDCTGKKCGLIVRDDANGFDYHMWLSKKSGDSIYMIINTSIHHPHKLINKEKTPVLLVNSNGSTFLKIFSSK